MSTTPSRTSASRIGQALDRALGDRARHRAHGGRAGAARRGAGIGRGRHQRPAVLRARCRRGRSTASASCRRRSSSTCSARSRRRRSSRCTRASCEARTTTTRPRRCARRSAGRCRAATRIEPRRGGAVAEHEGHHRLSDRVQTLGRLRSRARSRVSEKGRVHRRSGRCGKLQGPAVDRRGSRTDTRPSKR